ISEQIGQVDQEADQNHGEDQHHHHALHHDQIALGDGLEDQSAEAGQGEDVLDDDAARQQEGKLKAEDGQDRDPGVAQGVSPQGLVDAQALGAGGADIVLVHGVEQGGAQDARQNGGLRRGQSHGGQDQGLEGGPEAGAPAGEAARREPAQVHREQQDQQHGDPEVGQGDPDLGHADQAGVDGGSPAAGGGDADGQGDQQRQDGGHQGQRRGDR